MLYYNHFIFFDKIIDNQVRYISISLVRTKKSILSKGKKQTVFYCWAINQRL